MDIRLHALEGKIMIRAEDDKDTGAGYKIVFYKVHTGHDSYNEELFSVEPHDWEDIKCFIDNRLVDFLEE